MLPQPPWMIIRGLMGVGFSDDEGGIVDSSVREMRVGIGNWMGYIVWS